MPDTSSYTIVGLSHNLKGRAQAFLDDLWEHRWEVMLCHDTAYPTDPHAIAAIVGCEMVGHVASRQCADFWPHLVAMAQCQGTTVDDVTVYAEVVAVDRRDGVTEHVAFEVVPDFEGVEPVALPIDNVWQDWGQTLPPLPQRKADVLYRNAARSLRRMATSARPLRMDDVVKQLDAYRDLSRHELSLEHRQLLMEVTAWLLGSSNPQLQALGVEYRRLDCAMNEAERVQERLTEWWPEVLTCAEGEQLWAEYRQQHAQVAPEHLLAELMAHLKRLPGTLSANLSNGSEFFKGLYYQNTPREVLRKVYGCVVLCAHICRELHAEPENFGLVANPCHSSDPVPGRCIPFDWITDWAAQKANQQHATTVRTMLSDYVLEQRDPVLLVQLDAMEHSCHTHAVVEQLTIEQDLNFNAPVAQAIAHVERLIPTDITQHE